ncbi:hypothetical protein DL96DRAFT_1551149 [Flagelloscypha sp. PMI_526]|nr:hypothetical protein DL96DRAFT_1551149 [Flagelloscypha sp. PMI_526]
MYGSNSQGTPLTFTKDGSSNTISALSELYILQDAAGRWASDTGIDLCGEDVCPSDMFDIIAGTGIGGFYAILFARLELTVGQAIQAHRILEERLFNTEIWSRGRQNDCLGALNDLLDEISSAETCRLLRNYRPRGSHSPQCTIRQVLQATFADCDYLPPVRIQDEDFISALNGYANPSRVLMKELGNTFPKQFTLACVASIGAGHSGPQGLANALDSKALASFLQSSELTANEFASRCHELGAFFFRLSVASQLSYSSALEPAYPRVKGTTMAYLDTQETAKKLDDLVEALIERPGVVSLKRLGSLAGKGAQTQLVARVQKVQRTLDDSIFRDIKTWLQPIQQTSKLDANVQARGETTCEWILRNATFLQWMEARGGLFWYHGLMGTGKTFTRFTVYPLPILHKLTMSTSSFMVQLLLRRDDFYVAYYYFEFTNPTTLSEEALYRSLVSQLAQASPAMMCELHQKHNHGSHQPHLATLQATLTDLVSCSPKPVFIVIDALDELPQAQRKYLLQSLCAFCSSMGAYRTHVMVTSREDRDIRDALNGKVDFQLGVQGDLVRQDIAAYVDQQLAIKKWICWPRDDIMLMRRVLNDRADGQRKYVIKDAWKISNGGIPSHQPVFKKANHFHDPLDLLDLGASLVSQITDRKERVCLQLAHASVKEYLLADSGKWYALQEGPAHNLIASACLAVLLHFQALMQSYLSSPFPYSLINWYRHIFPNGPPALLNQQKELYATHPWPNRPPIHGGYYEDSPLSSAASFCLLDFLETILIEKSWDTNALGYGLVAAAGSQRTELLPLQCSRLLLKHGAKVDHCGRFGTALQTAAQWGNLEVAQLLVYKGADIRAGRGVYGTALHVVAFYGRLEVARFLLEKGADVNAVGGEFGLALQAAAMAGWKDLEVVQLLVERGADVNAVGGRYGTALQAAAEHGSLEVVQFLVEHGAKFNAVGGMYEPTLEAARKGGKPEIIKFLVEKGADISVAFGYKRLLGSLWRLQHGMRAKSLSISFWRGEKMLMQEENLPAGRSRASAIWQLVHVRIEWVRLRYCGAAKSVCSEDVDLENVNFDVLKRINFLGQTLAE